MYIISVVRLRIRPDIATPAWADRCIFNDNSCFTQLDINSTCSTLINNTHMACAHASKDTCPYSNIGPSWSISAFPQWYFWILLYMTAQTHLGLLLHIIMNVTDYWPMAREYLIQSIAVAALQFFGQVILKHMFSVVLLNKSTMISSILLLHIYYASSQKKFYSVTSWPHSMPCLKANLH